MEEDVIIPVGSSGRTRKRILKRLPQTAPPPPNPSPELECDICDINKCSRPEGKTLVRMHCCNKSVHIKCLATYWYNMLHQPLRFRDEWSPHWYLVYRGKDIYKCPCCFTLRYTVGTWNGTKNMEDTLWYLTWKLDMDKWE